MLDPSTPKATSNSYWSVEADVLVGQLGSAREGLTAAEARRRLREHGPNQVREHRRLTRLQVLANQIRNPLLWVLVFAAGASAMTGEWVDAVIVFVIVLATVSIGYAREYNAEAAAAALQARVRSRARVLRDGQPIQVPTEEVVPGEGVRLSAGSLIPADGVILEATDFFVSEAVLTGESFPVEKRSGSVATAAGLRDRLNCVFLGTNVRSGTARCVIAATGLGTQFGAIAHRLTLRPPETEFDRGIRRFGYLLTSVMLVMVVVVFIVHLLNGRPPMETMLFSVPLAVGLTPELLPPSWRQPRQGRADDGWSRRVGTAPDGHREPREHGCSVYRQDGHPDARRGGAGGGVRRPRSRVSGGEEAGRLERGTRDRPCECA